MPTQVDIPGIGIVEFPDGMTDDQISLAIKRDILKEEQAPVVAPQAAPEPPAEEGGFLSGAQDLATRFAQGAVGSARTVQSAFGATSADDPNIFVDADTYLKQFLSAQSIKDEAEQARILKEAESAGVLDQVVAGAKAFGVAPLDTTAGGAGSIVLTAAPVVLGVPGRIAGATIGGLQGLGTVKQEIYDGDWSNDRR